MKRSDELDSRAQVALAGGYEEANCDQIPANLKHCVGDFVLDPLNKKCYKVLNVLSNESWASDVCLSNDYAVALRFRNDSQVSGFIELLKSGSFLLLKDNIVSN